MENRKEEAWELRAKAEKYRRLAGSVIDQLVKREILQLAEELEQRASDVDSNGSHTDPSTTRRGPSALRGPDRAASIRKS